MNDLLIIWWQRWLFNINPIESMFELGNMYNKLAEMEDDE